MELDGAGWVHKRNAQMSIGQSKVLTKGSASFFELLVNYLSILDSQNHEESRNQKIIEYSPRTNLNPCRKNCYAKYFKRTIAPGMNSETELIVIDTSILENCKNYL